MNTVAWPAVLRNHGETEMTQTTDNAVSTARLDDIAHDVRILHEDLSVPLDEAVQTVVSDSDYVAPDEREATVTAVLDRLTD